MEIEQALKNMPVKTRSRIEAAVLELFSAQEFRKVKLVDVAVNAHVSLQTIYKYYGNKEMLLFCSLDTWLGNLAERINDHLRGIENYKDRLRKLFWVMLDYFDNNHKVAKLIMSSAYLSMWRQQDTFWQSDLMAIFMRLYKEGHDQNIFASNITEEELLDFVTGVTMQSVATWLTRENPGLLTEKTAVLFDMIWYGVTHGVDEAEAA